MPNKYETGEAVRVSGEFRDIPGNSLVDPPTVRFKYKKPDGTVVTYTYGVDAQLVRESTGKYFVLIDSDTYGDWWYRWETDGPTLASKSAEESYYSVLSHVV